MEYPLVATGTDDVAVESLEFDGHLDLRDEERLQATETVRYDPEGVRLLLAAINLQPSGAPLERPDAEVVDLAIFRATGSRELARIFGTRR